jgi:hypothetical protein
MLDVDAIRKPVLALNDVAEIDRPHTFYYDETNNLRKLVLRERGLNVPSPGCFAVGGIVHRGSSPCVKIADLRERLRTQPSATELKLKHVAKGSFLELLGSRKLGTVVQWLSDQGFLVHFLVVDLFYWATTDIVDSLLTGLEQPQLFAAHTFLKDALFSVLRTDLDATASLLKAHNYPDVGRERIPAFLAALKAQIDCHPGRPQHSGTDMVRGLIDMASDIDSLPFLEDDVPDQLVERFGDFYLSRLALFTSSQHVFDEEASVEAFLRKAELAQNGRPLSHFRFADSKDEPGIQLSDIVIGVIGKMFDFVASCPAQKIDAVLNEMTSQQRSTLEGLASLIDRSIDQCPAFAHYIISGTDQHRASLLLGD